MVALLCHLPLRRNCRAKRRSPLGETVGAPAQLTLRPSSFLINLFFSKNDNDLVSVPPMTARTAEDRLYPQNLQAQNQSARSARSNTSEHCPKASRTEFAPTSQGCRRSNKTLLTATFVCEKCMRHSNSQLQEECRPSSARVWVIAGSQNQFRGVPAGGVRPVHASPPSVSRRPSSRRSPSRVRRISAAAMRCARRRGVPLDASEVIIRRQRDEPLS